MRPLRSKVSDWLVSALIFLKCNCVMTSAMCDVDVKITATDIDDQFALDMLTILLLSFIS